MGVSAIYITCAKYSIADSSWYHVFICVGLKKAHPVWYIHVIYTCVCVCVCVCVWVGVGVDVEMALKGESRPQKQVSLSLKWKVKIKVYVDFVLMHAIGAS